MSELDTLRLLSRAAFGQAYRLEVMLAVADSEDGLVTQTELSRALGVSVSNVQGAVRSLTACGLLTELPQGDSRSKFLLRNPSSAWDWVRELREHARLLTTQDAGRSPSSEKATGRRRTRG